MLIDPSVFIDILALYAIAMVWRNMSDTRSGQTERLFRVMLMLAAIMLVIDGVCWQLDGWVFPGCRELLIILSTLLYLLQAFYCLLWLRYEILWIYGRIQMNRRLWAGLSLIPLAVVSALLLVNLWTRNIFVIGEDCRYFHSNGYLLVLGFMFVYVAWAVVIAVAGAVRAKDAQRRRSCLSMVQFISLQIIGSASEIFSLSFTMTPALITSGLLMVYLNVQQRTATQQQLVIARQKQELTEKQIAVMLSQIQPHFLYNAMGAIEQLCLIDPPAAKHAMNSFSHFLRSNLDSLANDKPISFEQELKHTDNYLSIEKMRFQNCLNIEYDIEATLFRLPTLTLQPIVENAVRYGVTKKDEGGTVTISSKETADAFVVTVSDDGVGFDPMTPHSDGRTHIGIQNVRSRLANMVKGTLDIKSTPGVGTVATITIPKEDE